MNSHQWQSQNRLPAARNNREQSDRVYTLEFFTICSGGVLAGWHRPSLAPPTRHVRQNRPRMKPKTGKRKTRTQTIPNQNPRIRPRRSNPPTNRDAIIANTPKPQSGIERANPTHHTRKFLIPKVEVCVHDNQPLQPREFSFQRYFLHRL